MHFDIQVVLSELNKVEKAFEHVNKNFTNITLNFENDKEEIIKNLSVVDLLIIDLNYPNLDSIVKLYEKSDKYILFLGNKDRKKTISFDIEKFDFMDIPIDLEELTLKIKNYTNLLDNHLLLKKEQELSNSIINSISNPIFLTDNNSLIFANDFLYRLLGLNSLEEINKKYKNISEVFVDKVGFISPNSEYLSETLENAKVCIFDMESKCNKYFTFQKIFLTHNNTYIIILNDISHEITHKQELYHLLYTDNLTKLPNRAKLIDELQNKSIHLESIAILDIKAFKEINDFFGHKVGDYILNEIALLINNCINKESMNLYKFPSDTYCVTNTDNDKDAFIEVIKKINDIIYKKSFLIDQHEIDTRITTGISFSNKNNKLITADIALQSAKKANKDFEIFYDQLDKFQEYENNMLWTKKLKNAFLNDNIVVFYQPLVNNTNLQVEKYECLVRMIDEKGDVISPFFFLDISKKSNQYSKITRTVIDKSFKQFENLDFEFSVNISYEDIEDTGFLEFIKSKLTQYNVANKVVFEILEDENVKNYELLIEFIKELKELGCKVAIDDFGSGYSNFEHLLKMEVDYLKIDASLIKNVAIDENSYKITKTIIEFAKSLNLKTIAEYVENKEIFEIVKDLGTDYSQGYYFSAPIKEPSLTSFKKILND